MNEKLLKSQKMLLGVLGALLFMLIICAVSTAKDVPAEKELTLLTPDRIQNIDEETRQADLTIDQNNEDRSSLAFFTSHQYVEVTVDGENVYSLNSTGGIWGHTTGNV